MRSRTRALWVALFVGGDAEQGEQDVIGRGVLRV